MSDMRDLTPLIAAIERSSMSYENTLPADYACTCCGDCEEGDDLCRDCADCPVHAADEGDDPDRARDLREDR